MSTTRLDELVEAAWSDYEHKLATNAPFEHLEAAAEHLYSLMALRQRIEITAETWAAIVEKMRPALQRLREEVLNIARRFSALAKDLHLQQRQQSKPPGDQPSQLTRVQARAKGRPQTLKAASTGFGNPATIRR